jgi:hypothetical protein
MKKLILLTCILLSFSELFANKNDYKPGYVILESGDTLVGRVKTKNWRINPTKVTFIVNSFQADTITYSIKEIKGFSGDDFIFTKRALKIDIQPNELTELTQSNTTAIRGEEPLYKEDTVLLQTLVGGKASLYIYTEASGRVHYYLESDVAELQELLNTMYVTSKIEAGGFEKNFVGYAQEYKTQLLTSLIGCASITFKECDIDFKESELKKLIFKFNACVDPSTALYSKKKEELIIAPYLGAGMAFASMKFKAGSEYYNYLVDADFSNSTSFTANFGVSFILPKYSKKLSIYSELAYNSYHFESQVNQTLGFNSYSFVIDYSQIGLNLGASYNLSKNKVSPYLKAGITMLYSFNYTMEATNETFGTYDFWPDPRQLQWGLNLGAGINFDNLAFEYQFLVATGFSANTGVKNTPLTNSITIKYTFISKNK